MDRRVESQDICSTVDDLLGPEFSICRRLRRDWHTCIFKHLVGVCDLAECQLRHGETFREEFANIRIQALE